MTTTQSIHDHSIDEQLRLMDCEWRRLSDQVSMTQQHMHLSSRNDLPRLLAAVDTFQGWLSDIPEPPLLDLPEILFGSYTPTQQMDSVPFGPVLSPSFAPTLSSSTPLSSRVRSPSLCTDVVSIPFQLELFVSIHLLPSRHNLAAPTRHICGPFSVPMTIARKVGGIIRHANNAFGFEAMTQLEQQEHTETSFQLVALRIHSDHGDRLIASNALYLEWYTQMSAYTGYGSVPVTAIFTEEPSVGRSNVFCADIFNNPKSYSIRMQQATIDVPYTCAQDEDTYDMSSDNGSY